jgi:hypothetical protein
LQVFAGFCNDFAGFCNDFASFCNDFAGKLKQIPVTCRSKNFAGKF